MQSVGYWVAKGAWCTTSRGGSAHRVTFIYLQRISGMQQLLSGRGRARGASSLLYMLGSSARDIPGCVQVYAWGTVQS